MRIAPHATRAARMAVTVLPLALLAAACTAALPASGPGASVGPVRGAVGPGPLRRPPCPRSPARTRAATCPGSPART
jgi:hypothetical protein